MNTMCRRLTAFLPTSSLGLVLCAISAGRWKILEAVARIHGSFQALVGCGPLQHLHRMGPGLAGLAGLGLAKLAGLAGARAPGSGRPAF